MKWLMEWAIVIGCVLGGWSMLRLIGGERQRQLAERSITSSAAQTKPQEQLESIPELK